MESGVAARIDVACGTGAGTVDGSCCAVDADERSSAAPDAPALDELADCPRLPHQFAIRVRRGSSHPGDSREELLGAVEQIRALARETEALEPELLALGEHSPAWLRLQTQAGTV